MIGPALLPVGIEQVEPFLWVALDAALGALVGRELVRSWRQRQARLAKIARARRAVQNLLQTSARFVADGQLREAVLHAYPALVAEIRERFALPHSSAATHLELLDGWRKALPEALHGVIAAVYQFYEPVRYGERDMDAYQGSSFRGSLERAVQLLGRVGV